MSDVTSRNLTYASRTRTCLLSFFLSQPRVRQMVAQAQDAPQFLSGRFFLERIVVPLLL